MSQKDDAEKQKRIEAYREAVKRAQKELKQEERRQKGFLQNLHEDSNGIAENLRERATGLVYGAIGFSDEKKLSDTVGPVLGFVGGLYSAFTLAAASVPFAAVARTTKIAAAITGRRFKKQL
jgi:hypothetical protein